MKNYFKLLCAQYKVILLNSYIFNVLQLYVYHIEPATDINKESKNHISETKTEYSPCSVALSPVHDVMVLHERVQLQYIIMYWLLRQDLM
jgi:hypothetical protein